MPKCKVCGAVIQFRVKNDILYTYDKKGLLHLCKEPIKPNKEAIKYVSKIKR